MVVDTCSVKQYPIDCMLSRLPDEVQILGTHPLFGPDSGKEGIGGMKIAVCPVRIDSANYDCIRDFLQGLGLEVIETTPREHDRRLARTQAIFHLISQALKELDWRGQRLSTPGPDAFYRLAETVQNDTSELFRDMEQSQSLMPARPGGSSSANWWRSTNFSPVATCPGRLEPS